MMTGLLFWGWFGCGFSFLWVFFSSNEGLGVPENLLGWVVLHLIIGPR